MSIFTCHNWVQYQNQKFILAKARLFPWPKQKSFVSRSKVVRCVRSEGQDRCVIRSVDIYLHCANPVWLPLSAPPPTLSILSLRVGGTSQCSSCVRGKQSIIVIMCKYNSNTMLLYHWPAVLTESYRDYTDVPSNICLQSHNNNSNARDNTINNVIRCFECHVAG